MQSGQECTENAESIRCPRPDFKPRAGDRIAKPAPSNFPIITILLYCVCCWESVASDLAVNQLLVI